MTDNEIIKALECCKTGACLSCPKWKNEYVAGECNDILHFALNLINRQKAEIEALKASEEQLQSAVILANRNYVHVNGLFEDAREKATRANKRFAEAHVALKTARSEAIKEFAERLVAIYENDKRYDRPEAHTLVMALYCNIDNLVKKMTEGTYGES